MTKNYYKIIDKKALKVYQEVVFSNSIVSITDQNGIILLANENFCKISGYCQEELVGENHRIVNSGYHSKEFFKEMYSTLLGGNIWKGEICNKSKNGGLYWVDTIINPVWNSEINEYRFISVRLEITHRKKYESVLQNVQKIGKIGFWELELDSNHLFWSDEIYHIFDLNPSEFNPTVENSFDFFLPESLPSLEEAIAKAMEQGTGYDLELALKTAKGRIIWTRAVSQVEFVDGRPFKIYGTFQDIDKRKRMRMELNKSQVQLNLALEAAGIGNWAYFPELDELIWDDSTFEIFGVNKEKFEGKFSDWVNCLHPCDVERSKNEFLDVLKKQQANYDSHFRIIHPEKGTRYIKGKAIIEYNKEGQPIEINGLNFDVSNEIEYQNGLIEAREKALEATQAKSSFLASMSHEIRTPMNGMMGMLELLSESALGKEQRELVDTILSCSDQLLTIVNDILDFSKIEAGKMTLEYRSFDIRNVLKGVKSIFEAQAMRKGVKIKLLGLDNTVPFIKGDETRLKQILSNLVSNALKFTEKGEIKISITQDKKRSSKNMGTFLFQVHDTGIGIPLEKQKYLFQSFKQIDDSTSREYGGSGLGLTICKSLVEKMGGHIGVESSEGAGSIFFFEVMAGIALEEDVYVKEKNKDTSF